MSFDLSLHNSNRTPTLIGFHWDLIGRAMTSWVFCPAATGQVIAQLPHASSGSKLKGTWTGPSLPYSLMVAEFIWLTALKVAVIETLLPMTNGHASSLGPHPDIAMSKFCTVVPQFVNLTADTEETMRHREIKMLEECILPGIRRKEMVKQTDDVQETTEPSSLLPLDLYLSHSCVAHVIRSPLPAFLLVSLISWANNSHSILQVLGLDWFPLDSSMLQIIRIIS